MQNLSKTLDRGGGALGEMPVNNSAGMQFQMQNISSMGQAAGQI